MSLPQKLPYPLMLTQWAAQLNPILANPLNSMSLVKNVNLVSGTNVINHLLGTTPQSWVLTDIQGAAVIYRNAEFTSQTLSLHSSAPVTVSIGVF